MYKPIGGRVPSQRSTLTPLFNTFFVVLHAVLYAFMEVEMEGTSGWMYDSPTQCSFFMTFTNYHLIMNVLIVLTVYFIVRPSSLCDENLVPSLFEWAYYIVLYFAVEDETWFVINEIRYRSAPWQGDSTAITSVITTWALFLLFFATNSKTVIDCVNFTVLLLINGWLTVYAFAPINDKWDDDVHRNVTMRQDYCI